MRNALHVIALMIILSAIILAAAWLSANGPEADRMISDETGAQLDEKLKCRQAFLRVAKQFSDAIAEGGLPLDHGTHEFSDCCSAEFPWHLESLNIKFGDRLSDPDLAFVSILRTIDYYRELGEYRCLSAEVEVLLNAMPREVWIESERPDLWLSFIRDWKAGKYKLGLACACS